MFRIPSLQFMDLSHCPSVEYLPSSFDKLSNLEYLNLSQCVGLKALPKSLLNHKKLQIEVFGCQDYIVQSCHQCSQLIEEVGTSNAISDITPKDSNKAEGISASDADEVDYPRNNLKQKLAFAYHMDEQKGEEPKFINKPNSNGEIVQVIPGNQFSSSPPHFSSVASSSSAVFASGSFSDVSLADHPLSNDETAGLQPDKKFKEPQALAEDDRISEQQRASLSHMPAHPHEATAAKRSNVNHITEYRGEYLLSVQCSGSNQGVASYSKPNERHFCHG